VTLTKGVDVSQFQGLINWAVAHQNGVEFAFIKATEGTGFTDPLFATNWAGTKAAGVARAAYHFLRPDLGLLPAAEADHFASVVKLSPGDVVAADLEVGGGDLTAYARGFLDRLVQAHGFPAGMLYGSTSFLRAHVPHGIGGPYGLWQAQWGSMPTPASGWPFWAVWQDTDAGSVPGIPGRVDEDVFQGDLGQFLKYGLGGAPVPVEPPPVAPVTHPSPLTPPVGQTYVVKPGDTLSALAGRFRVSVSALMAANPIIKNPNLILVGWVLHVPGPPVVTPHPSGGRSVVVTAAPPTNTLSGIAGKMGVSLATLKLLNPQLRRSPHEWNLVYPGDLVHLP